MNCRPPRPMLASRLADPAPANARILKRDRWNIGSGTRWSRSTRTGPSSDDTADQLGQHHRARPSHRVRAVRLQPVGQADHDEHETRRERHVAPDVQPEPAPGSPSRGASRRPRPCRTNRTARSPRRRVASRSRRVRHRPAGRGTTANVPAMMLNPSAMPRWDTGNASVRIAVELAMSIAPPTPWTSRRAIRTRAPPGPLTGEKARPIEATVKTRKPGVVHLDPAELVPDPAEGHDQHGGHHQVAREAATAGIRSSPGASGWRWIPLKIAGSEMITIDWFKRAMNEPSVVFERRSTCSARGWSPAAATWEPGSSRQFTSTST